MIKTMKFLFISLALLSLAPLLLSPNKLVAQTAPSDAEMAELLRLLGGDTEELLRLLEGGGEGGGAGRGAAQFPGFIDEIVAARNPRTLSYSPGSPEPGERVTVEIVDHGRPTSSLLINWHINGELFSSGIGARSISFVVGEVGTVSEVYAEVVSPLGIPERTPPITIGASYLDLLWEAFDADAPPFYKGRTLPSWDSIVRVHVIPTVYSGAGTRIQPGTFVYTWEKNARRADLSAQSGYGRDNVFVLADFTRRSHLITVSLANVAKGVSVSRSVGIRLHDPEILLYEKHPLGGVIFERALTSEVARPADGSALRIVAYPFGMDARSRERMRYEWRVDGRRLTNTAAMNRGEISLIPEGRGTSRLEVRVNNDERMLQSGEELIRITTQ